MSLIIQKYGGTSVGSIARIRAVATNIVAAQKQNWQLVVVVSAMAGETKRLIDLFKEVGFDHRRERDAVISVGEQISAGLLATELMRLGTQAVSLAGDAVGIQTDAAYGKARITDIRTDTIRRLLEKGIIPIVPGFQGRTPENSISTLGRGGSDTTAVALAASLKATECQIFTDVDGIYTTDPRVCKKARLLPHINFEEMLEMASLGSKVLQLRSVEFAGKYKVPLRVLSSMIDNNDCKGGTLITYGNNSMEKPVVTGVAFNREEAKITVVGVPDKPGIAHQVLADIANADINVDVIVQNVGSNERTDLSFTVHRDEYDKAMAQMRITAKNIEALDIIGNAHIGKVSVVGIGMKSHAGVASKMFASLAAEKINIQMISTSEIKISVIIDEDNLDQAVCTLHDTFELEKPVAKA